MGDLHRAGLRAARGRRDPWAWVCRARRAGRRPLRQPRRRRREPLSRASRQPEICPANRRRADDAPRAPGYPPGMITTPLRVGARSSTAPLRDVLVMRPGRGFGQAFDDPAHGFLHPVDLAVAQREFDGMVETLDQLGVRVHALDADPESDADLCYVFDPLLIGPEGATPLRPGKPNRQGEPAILERWLLDRSVPIVGRIEAPGTVEAGDTVWLRDDVFVIGRSLRTN